MNSLLSKMKDISQTYVDLLSEILKVDVTIVDNAIHRIAGSGKLANQIGMDVSSEGHIIQYAIDTKEMQIVENPGQEGVCLTCAKRDNCKDIFEMWVPLIVGDDAIGVLGLACFNQRQRTHILKNKDTYLQFLIQFAGLLTLKAQELLEQEKNDTLTRMLEKVVDRIDIGVLVFSRGWEVTRSNRGARKILGELEGNLRNRKVDLAKTGNEVLGLAEYRLSHEKGQALLVGDLYDLDIAPYSKLFIFNSADILKQNTMGLAGIKRKTGTGRIISASAQMNDLKRELRKIAAATSNVLITGEVGVGKKLYASVIHQESARGEEPFLVVNCEYVPDEQLELELWGLAKPGGKGQVGKLEAAGQGTLFLEEVGELSLAMQKRLLAVLESGQITRVGGTKPVRARFRLISSTQRDLAQMVEEGRFIRGLYYKLNVLPLEIPPLRERKADIRILAMMYLNFFSRQMEKEIVGVEDTFWAALENYGWPGNVSELRNNMEYVVSLLGYPNVVTAELLTGKMDVVEQRPGEKDYSLDAMEQRIIAEALEAFGHGENGKRIVAQKLGLSLATLYRKIQKYHLKAD